MDERLGAALEPVLADVRFTLALDLRVEDREWADPAEQPGAYLWAPDGSGIGVSVWLAHSALEQQIAVADTVQEFVVESVGGRLSNWPVCPAHPDTHPMEARAVDGVARWVCPRDGTPYAAVGELGPSVVD